MTSSVENQEMIWPTRLAEPCHSRDATTLLVIGWRGGFCSGGVGRPDGSHVGAPVPTLLPTASALSGLGLWVPNTGLSEATVTSRVRYLDVVPFAPTVLTGRVPGRMSLRSVAPPQGSHGGCSVWLVVHGRIL